jgi:hypothetical protein
MRTTQYLYFLSAVGSALISNTACSVEVSFSQGSDNPVIILRVPQNKQVDEEEKSKLQSLVDVLVKEISRQDESVWATKEGVFFSSC